MLMILLLSTLMLFEIGLSLLLTEVAIGLTLITTRTLSDFAVELKGSFWSDLTLVATDFTLADESEFVPSNFKRRARMVLIVRPWCVRLFNLPVLLLLLLLLLLLFVLLLLAPSLPTLLFLLILLLPRLEGCILLLFEDDDDGGGDDDDDDDDGGNDAWCRRC